MQNATAQRPPVQAPGEFSTMYCRMIPAENTVSNVLGEASYVVDNCKKAVEAIAMALADPQSQMSSNTDDAAAILFGVGYQMNILYRLIDSCQREVMA